MATAAYMTARTRIWKKNEKQVTYAQLHRFDFEIISHITYGILFLLSFLGGCSIRGLAQTWYLPVEHGDMSRPGVITRVRKNHETAIDSNLI